MALTKLVKSIIVRKGAELDFSNSTNKKRKLTIRKINTQKNLNITDIHNLDIAALTDI